MSRIREREGRESRSSGSAWIPEGTARTVGTSKVRSLQKFTRRSTPSVLNIPTPCIFISMHGTFAEGHSACPICSITVPCHSGISGVLPQTSKKMIRLNQPPSVTLLEPCSFAGDLEGGTTKALNVVSGEVRIHPRCVDWSQRLLSHRLPGKLLQI